MGGKSVILAGIFFSVVVGHAVGSFFDIAPDPNLVVPDNNGIGFDASLAANKHVGIGEEAPQPSVIRFQTTIPTTPAPRVVYVQQPPNFNHPPPPRRPCKRDLAGNDPAAQTQQQDPNLPAADEDIDADNDNRRGTDQIDQVAEDFKKFLHDNQVNLTKQDEDLLAQFKEHQKTKLAQQKQARSLPDAASQAAPILNQTGLPDRVARVPEMMSHHMMGGGGMMGQPVMGGGMMMGQQGMMSGGEMGMRSVSEDHPPNATHEQHARSAPDHVTNATHEQHVRSAPEHAASLQHAPILNQTGAPDRVARDPETMGQPMMGGGMMNQHMGQPMMGGGMMGQPMGQQMMGGGMMNQPMMGQQGMMGMRGMRSVQDDHSPNATHEQHARSAPEHTTNATAGSEVDRHFRSIQPQIIQQQQIPGHPALNQSEVPDRFIRDPEVMSQPMMAGGGMMNQPMGQPMMGGGMMGQPTGQQMMGGGLMNQQPMMAQGPGMMMPGGGMNMRGMRSAPLDQAPNATHEQHARNIPSPAIQHQEGPAQAADDHPGNLTKRAVSPKFRGSMAHA